MLIAFISYAFSLNIGALVGGTGFRFRLYSHAGLGVGAISRVVIFSVGANWMGYLLLAGGLFAAGGVVVPPDWKIESASLRLLGLAMLAATAAYLIACRLSHGRVFHVRGHHFRFPTLPLALRQLALAATNWSIMAAIVYVLMPDHSRLSGRAGHAAGRSGGLGHRPHPGRHRRPRGSVRCLARTPRSAAQLLAALLGYRAFYYLAPLMVAVALYLLLEARGGRNDG